jgi:hypothetical protein
LNHRNWHLAGDRLDPEYASPLPPVVTLENRVQDRADQAENVAEKLEHRADDSRDHDTPPKLLLVRVT